MLGIAKERSFFFEEHNIRKNPETLRTYVDGRSFYLTCKRGLDVLISLLVIVFLLSWLLPILAIIIKLDSRGPVFFIQKRVGFLGKTFRCFKLRTMIVNSVSDQMQATSDDPRITRLGKFLRITSLDEFPQFINVLLGDMSIVGPRPHMHKDNADFSQVVENYRFRYLVKPGITGMAQVKGYRGPALDFYSIFHRYQWDAFYIRNANLSLDFKVIRLTAVQILKSIFSFGIRENPENEVETATASNLVLARTVPSEQ
jgi:putative colanic acid biosynthesis UDP-glucose lipid carrier transferase